MKTCVNSIRVGISFGFKDKAVFKDKTAYVQAGGGIVYDSDPEAEYEETVAKSKGSLRAIDLAEEEY